MADQRISSRYANSLLQLALENKSLDKIFSNMQMISESIAGSSELQSMLKSPIISADKKANILDKIFSGKVEGLTTKFINLIVTKGRESELADICTSFVAEYNKMHKVAEVTLITAIKATDAIVKEVTSLLTKSGKYNKVSINQEVDENIIGGFILKMDDQLLDNSIQRKLQVIKKELQK